MSPSKSSIPSPKCPVLVGVFDSGVGGLSVARELMRQNPAQPIVYLADQIHSPYGQRTADEVRTLAEGITRFLLRHNARMIIVACNTASAAALRSLRSQFPEVPFVGMEPAVKPAAEHTRTGHIGVIATAATFQGELFASLLDRFAADVVVHTQTCPDLVPLVEAGDLNSERTHAAVRGYLAPLMDANIDKLVLGCTHYPFLRPVIERVTGPGVEIIDPAPAVARQAVRVLAERSWLSFGDAAAPRHRFYTSAEPDRFQDALHELLGIEAQVERAAWTPDGLLRTVSAVTL